MKIEPLIGDYCPDCARTLATEEWKAGSIVPLCKSCLNEMIRQGDMERASKYFFNSLESENKSLKKTKTEWAITLQFAKEDKDRLESENRRLREALEKIKNPASTPLIAQEIAAEALRGGGG